MFRKFIFDVDGTLTPSRGRMNVDFALWFANFCERQEVYLVTGSDRVRTVQQIGEYLYHRCKRVYQCSGNDVWEKDLHIRTNTINVSEEMQQFFDACLSISDYPVRTGRHVDVRTGLINFSVLGRRAPADDRASYIEWDTKTNERARFAQMFNEKFNRLGYEANVAGDTGLDITRMGNGKEQIIQDFLPRDNLVFFGDKMEEGGNDNLLSQIIPDSYNVNGWKETWSILKEIE